MADISNAHAVILGIVEGVTEFIPVSSTGHLILTSNFLGLGGEVVDTFEIFIQFGAILAVVALYFKRFTALFDFSSQGNAGLKGFPGMVKFALGCGPMFVLGALFGSKVKHLLFSPIPVALALIVGGVAIFLIDRPGRGTKISKMEDLSYGQCLIIGLFQCCALWPGMSRSASTIIGGLLLGTERRVAAEFSFLLAVPVIAAATAYDLLKSYDSLSSADITPFAIGFLVSFIAAALAVKFFISLLGRYTLRPFAWYRLAVGAVILILLGLG